MVYWFSSLLNEQLQRTVEDLQHRLSLKKDELQSAQEEIVKLEEKIGDH